ncbi:MAG: hypothetical protein PHR34_00755 [Kiritimatiellae bacterium]|nr:hypothetical protein [Kiritimatiellia bacterium]
MTKQWRIWAGLALVLVLAGAVRFHDLSRAAVRSDEINFLNYVAMDQSLAELWKNPPWFNQIPLADSVPIVWARLTRQAAGEAVIRQPFALLGWLTAAFCTAWMMRRRGAGAGLLLGVWMALLPYHVYHSREAYYYVLVMAFASGMSLRGADFMVRLRAGEELNVRHYAEWAAWALLACLSHMSVWVVAAVTWLLLGAAGWRGLADAARRRHAVAMGLVTAALGAGMIRWVLRALHEMSRAAADPSAHIGSAFDWVGPRVLPFFAGGANGVGLALLAAVAAAFAWLLWRRRSRLFREDSLHGALTALAFFGLAGSYAYIFAAGGGDKAKLTYFAANLPVFLAWAALTLHRAFGLTGERRGLALDAAAAGVVAAVLAVPAWQVARLGGKSTDYRAVRAWLDEHLPPGDTAIVDRWYEPWNEMRIYAPSNVFVTFTVPDEPYDNYVGHDWRGVTRSVIERNGAQAFIRLTRNHEQRMGLWTWPETWFRHRAVVTNTAGAWLRDTGFAPMEEFYTERNRVETEIFYDTREDIADKARGAGREAIGFFGRGWGLYKPWQQGDFADYRVLQNEAAMEVWNLGASTARVRAEVTAAAMGGAQTVQAGEGPPRTFPAGQLTTRTFDLDLTPGAQTVLWRRRGPDGAVLVREIRFRPAP